MKYNFSKSIVISFLLLYLLSPTGFTEDTQPNPDTGRIFMLEKALAPNSPDDLASLFAKARKERNAAVQMMLVMDSLKSEFKDFAPYWVSGTSSPWITSYGIKKTRLTKKRWQFVITYQLSTASGPFTPSTVQTLIVEPVSDTNSSQKFWVTKLREK